MFSRGALCLLIVATAPYPVAAQDYIGTALVPEDLASPQELLDGCMEAMSMAGYNLATVDLANGFLSGSRTSRAIGSSKEYTYTWNVTVRSKDGGITEVRMIRGTSGHFPPKDLDKLFPYIFKDRLKLDLSKIEVTIGDETRMADEWGKKKKKKKKKKTG